MIDRFVREEEIKKILYNWCRPTDLLESQGSPSEAGIRRDIRMATTRSPFLVCGLRQDNAPVFLGVTSVQAPITNMTLHQFYWRSVMSLVESHSNLPHTNKIITRTIFVMARLFCWHF